MIDSTLGSVTEKRIRQIVGKNKCCYCNKPAVRFRNIGGKQELFYCLDCFEFELSSPHESHEQTYHADYPQEEFYESDRLLIRKLIEGDFYFRFMGFC